MTSLELDKDTQLYQFNRLMSELLRGEISRNAFQRWEIELLLDIQGCTQKAARKRETLRRYQRAVQRHMGLEGGAIFPLSHYLGGNRRKAS